MPPTTCCRPRRTDDNAGRRTADAADGEGLTRLPRPAYADRQTPAGASVGRKRGAPGGAARRAAHVAAVPEHPTRTSAPPRRLTSHACAACSGRPSPRGRARRASVCCSLEVESNHAPVAQLDRASAFEAEGRRFEPCRARHASSRVPVCRRQFPRRGASRTLTGIPVFSPTLPRSGWHGWHDEARLHSMPL